MTDQNTPDLPVFSEPEKKKRGRKPKLVKTSRVRANPIAATFGERGRIASRCLPASQRQELVRALRLRGRGTEKLEARIKKLEAKMAMITGAEEVVAHYKAKLISIADLIDPREPEVTDGTR